MRGPRRAPARAFAPRSQAIAVGLALVASIGVADTATARGLDPRPGSQGDAQSQNGFSEVELKANGKRARAHHTVVVQLSHPHSHPHPTNPDGTPGRHAIPYEFTRTRVHRFCIQDGDGKRHRMVLTDAAGRHVLSLTAGEECVTATVEAGHYTVTLHHDGSGTPSDVNTVFIRPQFEPVDTSVLSSLTGAGPTPRASAGPIIPSADTYDAQCHSSRPEFVCCSHVDAWALRASNGFYVTVRNDWTGFCGRPWNPAGSTDCPGPGPFLSTADTLFGKTSGVLVPGDTELFEVFTCSLRGGTGPQFPKGTIFLSAPFRAYALLDGTSTGGFFYTRPSDPNRPSPYVGALVPGTGDPKADRLSTGHETVDVVGGGVCGQPLHLTYDDDGQISLSAALEERDWCADGPLSAAPLSYIIETELRFLSFYDVSPTRPVIARQGTAFFTPNHYSTILIATGSCSHCNLRGAQLQGYNFAGANLNGADLSGGAKLQGATLSFAYMPDADLTGADLTGAHLNDVDFYQVTKRPSLNGATLTQAQFANANLIGIDLSHAFLEGADFSGAQMPGALLKDITHVTTPTSGRVSFVKTLLAGADFSNSTFDGGDFTNAIFSTKSGTVDLLVRDSPTTSVTQPYSFGVTVRPLGTTTATVCPAVTSGPCTTAAQWVAQDPPIYKGYNDPDDW